MRQFNRIETLLKRKYLRKLATLAERILWGKLRNERFFNLKFFRQYGIGFYIADFYCPQIKLVIEADGGQHFHDEIARYDSQREEYIHSQGIRTLRFTNLEILRSIEGVMEKIRSEVKANSPLPPL